MQNSRAIVVRQMTLADVDAVHQIETLSITPPWTKQGFVDGLANANAKFYVAERNQIVGYCGLYFAADEGEITNVAVSPECRGRGIADAIIEHVLMDTCVMGLSQIFLEVRASNIPAQGLYQKHGFVSQGIRKNFYREPKEDAIVMMYER